MFNQLSDPHANANTTRMSLFTPYFALQRYTGQLSQDPAGLHLFALLCERLRQADLAAELLTQTIALLEKAYEETEDETTERRYAIANVNLGRVKLAGSDYAGAKEAYNTALGLLGDPEPNSEKTDDADATLLRIQARFGIGLASFKLGELEEALASFESASEGALVLGVDCQDVRGHITILTAQTLWAIGGEEAEDAAKAQLLEW